MNAKNKSFEFSDGEIRIWLEQEAIHIKAVEKFGDPVEITKEKALELSEAFKQLANQILE